MTGITFYYDTEAIGLNAADKRELEKYCRVLLRREDLDERPEMLRGAYEREEKERADLSVYASPPVNDVQEVGVFHLLTRSLFSRKVKRNLFRLNVSRYSGDVLELYFRDTQRFEEVRQIFLRFLDGEPISTEGWECTRIE